LRLLEEELLTQSPSCPLTKTATAEAGNRDGPGRRQGQRDKVATRTNGESETC